ncbi:MAG TPA: DUF748 domain-containing protein [Caldimonas sp.]|nr:DUF748 domain-containing protein [Caldimonas sp.]
MESTPRTPRRFGSPSTWLRIALALAALALLWSAAWFYMPPIVAAQAKDAAKRMLGRELTLGRVTFQPWTLELTIDDAALAGPAAGAPPLFEAKRIHADVAITSLVRLAPIVDALEVDTPMVRVTRVADGRYDVDDVVEHIAAFLAASAGKPPARYAVHNIVVRDGGGDFIDRPLATTHRLRDLALGVPFLSSLPSEREIRVEPHVAFTLDGSRFDTAGQATPFAERGNGELHLKIDGLAVQPYLGYLPRGLPAQPRAATLNADVVVAFEQRPKLSLKVAGTLGARDIEVVDAAAHELLKVGNVQVKIDELRPLERLVRLQRVAIDAPHVLAARDASGHVNLLLAAESPRGDAVPVARVPLPTTSASAAASGVRVAAASAPLHAASAPAAADAPPPWRVAVEALTLRAGRLDWKDAATAPAAAFALADVALDAQKIAWPPAAPVVFRGEAALGGDAQRGKLAFSGQGDGAGAKLTVSLASLPLAPLRPYLRTLVVPPLAGELSADVDVDWRAGDGPANVRALVRRLALAQMTLGEPGAPEAAAERIEVSDARIDTRARTLAIGRLALQAPRLRVERDAVRRWAHERWTTPAGETAPRSDAVAKSAVGAVATEGGGAAATPAWNLSLGELAVERGRVAIADRAHAVPVAVDVVDLAVELRGFALTAASAPFHISGRVAVPSAASGRPANGIVGSVDIRGELQAISAGVPGGGRATLLLKDLPLYVADPYLDDVLGIDVQRAQASFKGDARWTRSSAGMGVDVKGDLTLDDFRASSASPERAVPGRGLAMVRDGGGGRQLLNWKSLSLRGVEFAMAPGTTTRLNVGETTLSDFFARIALDESGHLNLQDVTHPAPGPMLPASGSASAVASPPAPQVSTATAVASGLPMIIRSGPIVVVGGRINYDDRFVKPNYNANLSEVSGRLESFSSEPPGPGQPPQLADLAVKGRVEGTATLEIAGKINPLAKPLALDLRAKVRDLELPPLSPYSIKYAGYGIERGKMSVDLAYVVQPSGELTATNKIVLQQLVFGDKAEGATTTLPVKLAVALLADSHGVIDLDLPVSGSINDPQFSIGGIVWKAITNIFVKAVSAPFTLLASAFGGAGGGERSYVEFAPGTAALGDAQRESLDKVAKALAERPGLTLTIVGESRLEREADAWKKERLAQLVRSEKRRQAIAAGGAASAAAAVTVSENEYATLLKEVYRRADIVKPKNVLGLTKDLPPAEMEALLLASMTVDNDAMQQLATRRGVAVRDYLASRDIAADRLFLGSPKTASEEASWTPRADLKLAAS